MELKTTTRQALSLTARLNEALESRDLEPWLVLLEERGVAMSAFEEAHQGASAEQREACREIMRELQEADRALQEKSEILLEELAGEFRGQLGSSSHTALGQETAVGQACLDRKA